MKNLKAKLRRDGGFTLIEMLIVVAIIAILIAISIPLVGQALERAREATDASNERSFKAELTTAYLLNQAGMGSGTAFNDTETYIYDAVNGTLATEKGDIKPYGQGTGSGAHETGGAHQGMYLWGKIDTTNGSVLMMWSENEPSSITANSNTLTSLVIVDTTT